MNTKLTDIIDKTNYQFTSKVKNQLADLKMFSEHALEWLMMEHYQFSAKNTSFLATAVYETKKLENQGVSEELQRNFNEERNHSAIYKKALFETGIDVNHRHEYYPTTEFFSIISKLITVNPSITLGAMYATETAAIFEHEVFLDISYEIIKRKAINWEKSRLKMFHEMHLNGVEQGHKDGLGLFVDLFNDYKQKEDVLTGANQAVAAMDAWWKALLEKAKSI